MNSVHRQFGKLTHKGGGDDAKVSVLLQDFDEADKMLTKVCSHSKSPWKGLISVDH
jgi:amphiphysin